MKLTRRQVLKAGALAAAVPAVGPALAEQAQELPESFKELKPLGERARPISTEEFQQRVEQAQRQMREAKPRPVGAVYLAPGSSLYYYTGIRWSGGERLFSLVIPATGEPLIVAPAFEEGRARELLRWPMEVRVWQEDESPYAVVARWLAERGVRTGRIGVEETMRFQFFDGLRKAAALTYVSADPITAGGRMRKTEHELELMRLANHATVDVYRAVFAALREGMTERDVRNLISQGFQKMGLSGGALVLFGQWAALPHGTTKPQKLKEGEVVLIDGGTSVEGYASDVTRCTVLGKPSEKLQRAFETVRRAQDAALEAAHARRTCGSVDDAARQVISAAGYGEGYGLFTHRLGHGIGLDGHEHPYLVRGSKILLQPGMTFSNEPGIYVNGDYGLRLEDIMVVRGDGPAELLTPRFSPSLENPCG